MKNVKRIIALILTIFCVTAVLTGCTYNVNVKVKPLDKATVNTNNTISTTQNSTVPTTVPSAQDTDNDSISSVIENTETTEPTTQNNGNNQNQKPTENKKMYVIGIAVARSSPDIFGDIITFLKCGEEVKKISTDGCYTRILYNNRKVYVLSMCLTETKPSILSFIGNLF